MGLKRNHLSLSAILWSKQLKIGRRLQRIYTKVAPWTRLILFFKPIYKLNTLSKLKSKYKLLSNSNVVYKIKIVQIVMNSTLE